MKHNKPIWTLLATLVAANAPTALLAAQLDLAQSPPGAATEPAPNIIVSVDDSGSMGATGIATLKSALQQTFSSTNVADNRIRLAWQSMNRCRGIPSNSTACANLNGMRSLQGAHRTNFMNWVNTLTANNGTPSHLMIDEAGKYLSKTNLGINSPWAASPGTQETPLFSCRKSFHIFMTDGGWNSSEMTNTDNHIDTAGPDDVRIVREGNADNTTYVLPDGVQYSTGSDQTRLYRDNWGSNGLSTLSDLAFYYWSRDLQPDLANNVRKSPKEQLPAENFGTTANPATLDAYWNPRNNPATWQHMVNYTIGFNNAATWTGGPTWQDDTFSGLAPIINGTTPWPTPFCNKDKNGPGNLPCDGSGGYSERDNERRIESWHAALNSRGRFIPAPNAEALVNAFKVILDDIVNQTSSPLVSIASSSSRLRANGFVYVAGFDSESWSGELGAYTLTAGTNAVSPTATWKATTSLDAAAFNTTNRLVLTHTGTAGTTFTWANLLAPERTAIRGGDTATVGENRVNYLRGVRSFEVANGGTMRNRKSRLGDIVNSNIWNTRQPLRMSFEHTGHATFRSTINALNGNTGRASALYVGANDGMLHAFNASNGQELFAYVPRAMYANLRNYTLTNYGHKFFVDGNPFTGDAVTSGTSWRTVLVSGLGGGGRGYFVLDVTDPASLTAASVLIDTTVAGNTPAVAGDVVENDIGHIYAQPVLDYVTGTRSEQIVKLNNGRWAVVMGNGVNSVNERPVLLIQYLDGTRGLDRIVADPTTGGANGLSAPRLIDINGDGTMDLAYAGDLQGNLWKFNLTSTTASNWGVSSWSATAGAATCNAPSTCVPLMVAKNSADARQPITAPPLWISNPLGGIQLLFGTGRNLTEADRSDTSTQTIYSVLDKSTYESVLPVPPATTPTLRAKNESGANITVTNARSRLVEQDVVSQVGSTNYFNTSENDVDYGPIANKRGWYFDLPASREKVLFSPQFFEGQKVIIGTNVPKMGSSGETCDFTSTEEDNWINVFNMISGKPSASPVWASADGSLDNATRTKFGSGEYVSINKSGGGVDLISFKNDDPACPPGQLCTDRETLQPSRVPGARADWREVR
jgi:type IV pilus assembly protein PilY1